MQSRLRKGAALFLAASVLFASCAKRSGGQAGEAVLEDAGGAPGGGDVVSVAVFVPGLIAGSAIYEMLARGVERAVAETAGATVLVIEGGVNQAEWEGQIMALAASGAHDLIVSSNPSLPGIVESVSRQFPDQYFLLLDAELAGNPHVYTLRYNQREQAYMAGHIAALVVREMAGGLFRVGLIAGQEYPSMNEVILPGYLEGARAVDPAFTVDFRVVGNWFDALKGAELAADMIRSGAKVILCVAGGANEGVVQAASEAGAKVVWFDTNGYAIRPGVVVGSAVVHQEEAAYELTKAYLAGVLTFGIAETAGASDGYVDFIENDPDYIASVSDAVRAEQGMLVRRIVFGELRLE